MLLRRAVTRAASKKFQSLDEFTDREKKKLEKVFLDDEIAEFFRWKRYPINDKVLFEGEAEVISWENYKIGASPLEDVKETAKNEKLDLVLVRNNPPVVRLMNYRNWILRWALQDHEMTSIYDKKKSTPTFRLSHRITDADIEVKSNRFNQLLKSHNTIIVESIVENENSVDEIHSLRKFESEFPKKIRSKLSDKSIMLKSVSSEYSVKIIIKAVTKGKEYSYYSLALNESSENWEKVEVHEAYNPEKDEESFMSNFLMADFAPKDIPTIISPDIGELSLRKGGVDYGDGDYEGSSSGANDHIKTRIKKLLGDELAHKFLKGRLKF